MQDVPGLYFISESHTHTSTSAQSAPEPYLEPPENHTPPPSSAVQSIRRASSSGSPNQDALLMAENIFA
jgi:hypothetical protein